MTTDLNEPIDPQDSADAAPETQASAPENLTPDESGTATGEVAPASDDGGDERSDASNALPDDTAPPGSPDNAQEDDTDETSFLPPQDLRAILEALIFASPNPVTPREINNVLGGIPRETWQAALDDLRIEYAREGRGLQLVDVAGGMQITTRPEYNDWVRELLNPKAPTRLSIQALETLAVIAYKQPVTLPEVIELRGVKSGGVIKTLLERRLVRITGRKEVVGRPMLYGTTKEFLLHFGLKDLTELPKIEEFAEVLGEEVDIEGLKKAIEAPAPSEAPLDEQLSMNLDGEGDAESPTEPPPEGEPPGNRDQDPEAEDPSRSDPS
jgi:segregation and condensation protein B